MKKSLSFFFIGLLLTVFGIAYHNQAVEIEKLNNQIDSLECRFGTQNNLQNQTTMSATIDDEYGYTDCDTVFDGIDSLIVYTPHYISIDYYLADSDLIPNGEITNTLYCAAAAFTGAGWENGFKHSLVAGDHVAHNHSYPFKSKRYHGYSCSRNTGAFVYYEGRYYFLYKQYSHMLDSAACHGGIGFAQEMMIHDFFQVQTTRPLSNVNVFRALCERNGTLCIVESMTPVKFGNFISGMIRLNVKEALYMDMGGWSYSWYRGKNGLVRPYPYGRERLTNAIVFMGYD